MLRTEDKRTAPAAARQGRCCDSVTEQAIRACRTRGELMAYREAALRYPDWWEAWAARWRSLPAAGYLRHDPLIDGGSDPWRALADAAALLEVHADELDRRARNSGEGGEIARRARLAADNCRAALALLEALPCE